MILLDTNVLARTVQSGHVHQQPALAAMAHLRSANAEVLVLAPQVLVEFYSIATRGINSLGRTPDQALAEIATFKQTFPMLPELPDVFLQWEALIAKYKLVNRHVYDARLVAWMLVHGVTAILTFNDQDFAVFTEVQVFNPFDVLGMPRV